MLYIIRETLHKEASVGPRAGSAGLGGPTVKLLCHSFETRSGPLQLCFSVSLENNQGEYVDVQKKSHDVMQWILTNSSVS